MFNMILIVLLCMTHVVWAGTVDYYHELSMTEFIPPLEPLQHLRNDSFFGFSTTYDRYNKRLIISAPRENNIGEVYECNITTRSCSKLGYKINRYEADKYVHDYWLGATVRAGSTFIIACAPRFTGVAYGAVGNFGHCYKRVKENKEFKIEIVPEQLDKASQSVSIEEDMDTLGWDMDIGDGDSVIVGGAAMFKRRGLAAVLPPKSSTPRTLKRIDKVAAAYNFGYSVAIGYFLNNLTVSYAVGSTYGTKGPGQVYFYTYKNYKFGAPYRLQKGEDVELVGSMFGAVLCAANLSKNRTLPSDLLVGAPTYALPSGYNAGAVYVYTYYKKGSPPRFKRRIRGEKDGSYFGSAIVNVGDLNGDGVHDVAIGAPYEDGGRGAVYLYCGATLNSDKLNRDLVSLQRLQPAELHYSFGLNLAALQDYDENGCNELAVSSPYQDKVSLYRCMAAVTITDLSAHFPNLQNLSRVETNYTFEVCMDVKYPLKPQVIEADIITEVKMEHPQARLTSGKNGIYSFETSLRTKAPQYCEDVNFTLPVDGDYGLKIGYVISTKLKNSPVLNKIFDSARVILSDASVVTHEGGVWAAECSGNNECISNLSLTIDTSMKNGDVPFIIGSSPTGTLSINVSNTGEVAYDPCVQIKLTGANWFQTAMDCSVVPELENTWECTSRKPLRTNMFWTINGNIVDLSHLTNRDHIIFFDVKLFDRCGDYTNTKTFTHDVYLRSTTEDIHIKGYTNIGDTVAMSKNDLIENGNQMEHVYTIVNNGLTNFIDLTSEVRLQKEKYIEFLYCHIEQSQKKQEVCNVVSQDENSVIVQCSINRIDKNQNAKIVSSMRILPSFEVYETVRLYNMTVNSSLIVHLDESFTKFQAVTTIIMLQEATIDLWILILAGIVGLCLIIILALILYECGFLRRKNKDDLKKLKYSIKRQTIRRSMMQHSPRTDRIGILEGMEEVDETAEVPSALKKGRERPEL